MRKWVINSVLESERTYLGILDILMQVSVISLFYLFIHLVVDLSFMIVIQNKYDIITKFINIVSVTISVCFAHRSDDILHLCLLYHIISKSSN